MKKEKTNKTTPDTSRRDFLVRLPMAAAALALSNSLGFAVTTEQGTRRLYLKFDGIYGDSQMSRDGIYEFSVNEVEKLKTGSLPSINIKWEISYDRNNWQKTEANITDKSFINKINDFAKRI